MATQVKFYSTTAASYSAITTKDAGGVYFVDGGELYKGASRFGANKVFQVSTSTDLASISGQISGDLAVGYGWTKAWNGSAWVQIENDVQIKTLVSLMASRLTVGDGSSYITHITQDENGNVSAHAQAFPTLNLSATTQWSSDGNVTVEVTTQSGAVTNVNAYLATVIEVSDVNAIDIIASGSVTADSIGASSGTFTNLTVTSTADFSVTNVSATNLTVGGKTVSAIADEQIAAIGSVLKSSTSNGITVSVTTSGGSVSKVELNASAFGNVMRFRDVVTALPSTNNKQGDIVIIKAGATSPLVEGQEYIWTSTTSTGTNHWELIGDQNTYATKAYVDASVSQLNSNKAKTGMGYTTDTYGISGMVELYSNSYPYFGLTVSPVSTSTDITTTAVKVVTANAVADYVTGKIGALDSTVSNGSSGVNVKVVQTDGKLTSLTTTITKASLNATLGTTSVADKTVVTAIGATGADTALPTEKAVRNAIDAAALVWLDANGSAIS